jgi:hypothetical protein
LKFLYRKLLYLCGLVGANPNFSDTVWRSAEKGEAALLTEQDLKAPVRWPLLLYAGLVVAAPYLMWRLLGSLGTGPSGGQSAEEDNGWQRGVGEHFIAKERFLLYR